MIDFCRIEWKTTLSYPLPNFLEFLSLVLGKINHYSAKHSILSPTVILPHLFVVVCSIISIVFVCIESL
jgi:hypothetical protein